ncbi:MAG: acetyltransferase, partial [Myxococcaceae bacterium]|nr:acetyltransferase [Myxococcaceae bacterium]
NLYLLGLLEEFGIVPASGRAPFTFWGRFLSGELTAAVFVGGTGGMVVPSSNVPTAIADIAKALHGKVTVGAALGEKGCVDLLLQHLGTPRPKVSRAQRLFAVSADDLGPFTNPLLRLAVEADVEQLIPMAAQAVKEIMNRDPLEEDPEGFPLRVRQRVKSKRTYVLEEKGQLVFKIDVGSRSQYGAELEGLFTVPDERRRGHATLSLGQISRHLLSSLPRLTLRVDDLDPALAGVARKVGYLAGRAQRLVVIA